MRKDATISPTALLEEEFHRRSHHPEAVFDAAPEIDGGGLLKIAGGTGDLADGKAEIDHLGQHFVVKNEVVGVFP